MAVGSRLCVVSFGERAQFVIIFRQHLKCTRLYVNTELAEGMAKVTYIGN
jgi:hypothetical protein